MEIILKEDVQKLGRAGDEIKVADGYGRNFLLPKKLAVIATPANKKRSEQDLNSKKGQAKRMQRDAEYLADAIQAKPLIIKMAVGEGGKLFGSVTTADIEKGLAERNITVDKRKIEMADAIKTLGSFEVIIKIHAEVTAKLSVVVEDETIKTETASKPEAEEVAVADETASKPEAEEVAVADETASESEAEQPTA